MSNKYYCLISSLPELLLDNIKTGGPLNYFLQEFKEFLAPEDYDIIKLLLLKYDNENIINFLFKKNKPFNNKGLYNQEQLATKIIEGERNIDDDFIDYLYYFMPSFKNGIPLFNGLSWENQLITLYFNKLMKCNNEFIRKWTEFELNLRNIITGFNCRKYKKDIHNELIGHDYITYCLKTHHSEDFGLGREYSFVNDILKLYETENIINREKGIDKIRWEYINELTNLKYFEFEIVIAFVLKLEIIERWINIEKDTGNILLKELLKEMGKDYKIPVEFDLHYGKL